MRYFLTTMTAAFAVAMTGQAFGQAGVGCFLAHPDQETLRRECIELRDDQTFDLVEDTVTGTLEPDRVAVTCNGNYASTTFQGGHPAPTWTVLRAKYVLVNKSAFVLNDRGVLTMADSSTVHLNDEVHDEAEQCVNCGINCTD